MEAMDICGDTLPLTVVSISNDNISPSVSLFYLVAGELAADMEFSNDHWLISTKRLKNDALHEQVQQHCRDNFLTKLDKRHLFEKNTPGYAVTERLPSYGKQIASVPYRREDLGGRISYRFSHSENDEVFVRIFEPASPSDTDIGVPGSPPKRTKMVRISHSH